MKQALKIYEHLKKPDTLNRLGIKVDPGNIELIPITSVPRIMGHDWENKKMALYEDEYRVEVSMRDVVSEVTGLRNLAAEVILFMMDNGLYEHNLEGPKINFSDNGKQVNITLGLNLREVVYGIPDNNGALMLAGKKYRLDD